MSFFENTRRPTGLGGKLMVSMMNLGHRALADWGFQFLTIPENAAVLDCGCGGGANIERLLKKSPYGIVKGIDYSAVSVEKSQKLNRKAVRMGRGTVLQVYFWPDLPQSFREVYRVLKPGGTFLICNECSDPEKDSKWTKLVDGMTIYTDVQLKAALEQASFQDVEIHKNGRGWLCVTAVKGGIGQ